uniref:Uncharacterized protein n=1 Tax=Rhizophora mucronata TaxID=61149 RepID=A0A2P2MYJ2_RHIMU
MKPAKKQRKHISDHFKNHPKRHNFKYQIVHFKITDSSKYLQLYFISSLVKFWLRKLKCGLVS